MGRLVALFVVGLWLFAAPVAQAAFPGQNGKIAFVINTGLDKDIWTINPDGSGRTNLTSDSLQWEDISWSPDGTEIIGGPDVKIFDTQTASTRDVFTSCCPSEPAWSPDATRIVYADGVAHIANPDGSNPQPIAGAPAGGEQYAWSPEGSKIAFSDDEIGPDGETIIRSIYTMNVDGSGATRVSQDLDGDGYFLESFLDWAPDGSKLAYDSLEPPRGIYTVNPDGTGATWLSDGSWPAWSPDGTKIAFAARLDGQAATDVYVMNADGTGVTRVTDTPEGEIYLDWQAVPSSSPPPTYDHPRLASPLKVPLVPNFRQTISSSQCTARGGVNSTHGPPLAFASCNPPGFVPGTQAFFGTQSSSWAQYAVIYGDTDPGNGDQADVTLRASLNAIENAAGSDYPADLTLVTKLRITDRFNGGSQADPATVSDFDYQTPIDCTSTAGPEGASCNLDSSADAATPGTIKENKATVLQVFRFRVNDSGTNGVRGDSDDRTFATQGIYIP